MKKRNKIKKIDKKVEKRFIEDEKKIELHPEVKRNIITLILFGLILILIISAFNKGGVVGTFLYQRLSYLLGWGYYLLLLTLLLLIFTFLEKNQKISWQMITLGGVLFFVSSLGLVDLISIGRGGFIGSLIGYLKIPFGQTNAFILFVITLIISFLIILNRPLKITKPKIKEEKKELEKNVFTQAENLEKSLINENSEKEISKAKETKREEVQKTKLDLILSKRLKEKIYQDYVFPPLSLLNTSIEKPTIGDLRANANIIKRTLESFGLSVEMGEINVGPTVTRYTLKPAEGIKLSRITALNQDLALALAAHPIRIEAPIPGKSLVGIEVPNKVGAVVRLGNLIKDEEFQKSGFLTFALGRNVSGEPIFANIEKMPHLLIAGATGSGKSITIHSLIISLLYKNSPLSLKLILIDPKRVELSVYNDLPHLVAPVVTDNKKAIGAFKWAISEMENRYQRFLEAGARDLKSYNQRAQKPLPYILIIVDELADLMVAYGREVEGAIIRLAQMSRATGIHLVVSTQRPSVEVITGLIKANITSRIALQVASQVDSRTILDMAGAERLLGNGDLLFISSDSPKPKRIQGAYISEEEIKKVIDYIKKNNKTETEENVYFEDIEKNNEGLNFDVFLEENNSEEDPLYKEAVKLVLETQKASASLLQRRLKIGYARAARLLDIMEEKGIIGPAEGAKPRKVYQKLQE